MPHGSARPHTGVMKQPITAEHQRWLASQLPVWQAAGHLDAAAASAIADSYQLVSGRRLNLARLLLTIGAAFVGIGVIWLVAANLDALSPAIRFVAVFVLFAAALFGAEWLAGRRSHQGDIPSPVVWGVRLLAALLLGGVIFQAAQSLQVPAYEPLLVGLWALGALLYAYLMRTSAPLVVGIATGVIWLVWAAMLEDASGLGFVAAMFAGAVLATALSHVHHRHPDPAFATLWRETGAALALIGLFAAAIPDVTTGDFEWSTALVVVLVLAVVAGAFAARRREGLLEPLAVVGMAILGLLLVWWEAGRDADNVDLASWAHAGLSVGVYVAAALWVAYLGIVHDSVRLTIVATAALVVFTTFQAFAVFAAIIQGAWLFVVLGLVLAGTGYLFDRARRELAASLAEPEGTAR